MRYAKITTSDHDALIRSHRPLIRSWARQVVRKYPLSFDEAYTALLDGFGDALTRWTPEGGASIPTFCRRRAFGAVQDYCRSIQWTPRGEDSVKVKTCGIVRDDMAPASTESPTLDAVISEELWGKIKRVLRFHKNELLVIGLIHQEGWTQAQAAKFMGFSPTRISQFYQSGLRILSQSKSMDRWRRGVRPAVKASKRRHHAGRVFFPVGPGYTCYVGDCQKAAVSRGMCWAHYKRKLYAKNNHERRSRGGRIGSTVCGCGKPAGWSGVCVLCQFTRYNRTRRGRPNINLRSCA